MEGWKGFDCYSKTVYCACVLYVTLSCQQASATVPKMEILIESSTLIFSAVLYSTPVIFSQVDLKLMRILSDKNYQNWSSGFGEKCLVLFLRSDRYRVWGSKNNLAQHGKCKFFSSQNHSTLLDSIFTGEIWNL